MSVMGVARQVGEHRLGAGERRLGVDHEPLLPDGGEIVQEQATVGKIVLFVEEGESSGRVERDQPGEEQAAEQHALRHRRRRLEPLTYPAIRRLLAGRLRLRVIFAVISAHSSTSASCS